MISASKKYIGWLIWLVVFLLPWQTRWIFWLLPLGQGQFEYGQLSLYGTTCLLVVIALLVLVARCHRNSCHQVGRWVGLVVLWLAVQSLWAIQPLADWYYVVNVLIAILFFYLAGLVPKKMIITAVISSAVVQSCLALWQFSWQYIPALSWLGLAEHRPEVLGQSVIVWHGVRILRSYGSLPHPNILAGFLALAIMLTVHQWIVNFKLRRDRRTLLFIGCLALELLGLTVTFSRAGVLALAVGLLLVFILEKRKKTLCWMPVLAVGIMLVIMAVTANYWSRGLLFSRLDSSQRLEKISLEQRWNGLEQASEMMASPRALVGYGPANYVYRLGQLAPNHPSFWYQPVHNSFILLLTEWGLVGVALLAWGAWPHIKKKRRVLDYPLITSVAVLGLFDHWLVSSYFGLMIVALVISLAVRPQTE